MPPTIPAPYQPHERNPLKPTPAELAVKKKARTEQAEAEDMAVNELRNYLQNAVQNLAVQFDRSEQHFWSLLHFRVKDKTVRRTSGFNAVVRDLAKKENKDRPIGAKLSVKELTQKLRADGLYEQMGQDEIDSLVVELNADKASKKYGKRILPQQKIGDISNTLKEVELSLLALHERSGIHAMMFAVRSDTDFSMAPTVFFTDDNSRNYLSDVRRIDPQDFATRYEGWILGGLKEITKNVQKLDANLREGIRAMVTKGLAKITGLPKVTMVYSENYDDRIVMRYGVHLEGWPLEKLINPGNISGLANLKMVSEALANGKCYWKRLTPVEFEQYKSRLEQEVANGTRKPLKHGGAIGETRIYLKASTRPKKRRRTNKENEVEDDGSDEEEDGFGRNVD